MQRILIVRLSAIGDVVFATSLLPPLRRAYPHAQIAWLTEDLGREIIADNPEIDHIYLVPRKRWRKLWKEHKYLTVLREVRELVRELRAFNPDIALDVQGLLRSAFWARASGAPRRVSLGGKEGSHLVMHEVVDRWADYNGRMCHQYLNLLEHLGIETDPFCLSLHSSPEYRAEARRMIPDNMPAPVFFYPFTTRPQKHWFDDRWAELAGRVFREMGREVWILGGPDNEATAERIAAASGVPGVRVVAGKTSNLRQKMALIERSAGGVGVDTGLTHMSIGLCRPTVALFGSTDAYLDTQPLPGKVLYDKLPCSPCHRHPTCNGAFTCMRNHSVARVFTALKEQMEIAGTANNGWSGRRPTE